MLLKLKGEGQYDKITTKMERCGSICILLIDKYYYKCEVCVKLSQGVDKLTNSMQVLAVFSFEL